MRLNVDSQTAIFMGIFIVLWVLAICSVDGIPWLIRETIDYIQRRRDDVK